MRKVGSRYSEIFGDKLFNLCGFGSEEYYDKVICDAGVKSHISFIFEPVGGGPNGEKRIVLYSKTFIEVGEELTYDYKFQTEDKDGAEPVQCFCGAKGCRKRLN